MEKGKVPLASSIMRRTWVLLFWNVNVAFVVSAEFINLLVLSRYIWPGEPFHALQMGALITARLWVDGISALFWGYLADRFDRKKIFLFNCTGSGVLVFANGFMPIGGGDGSYVAWLVIRVMIGVVMSGGGPTTNSLSTDLLQSSEKSQYFGYSSITWQITQVGAMVFSAVMFSIESLWRVYFWIAGAMFLCQSVLTALRFQEPPRAGKHESFTRIMGDIDVKYEYGLTPETIKATILKPTNMLVFAEGIFTNMLFGIIDLVWLPYIQSPPRNVSPFTSSVFILVYGVPGALLGSLVFGKLSDKIGAKHLKNRVSIIAWSLLGSMGLIFLAFILPLPELTVAEGSTIDAMFAYPVFFVFGILLMFMRCTFSIYGVNQPPVIQEINLPEAQGRLASMNQLLEIFSYGAGPLLAGIVLEFFQNNYQLSIQVTALVALPGIAMWFLAYFWIEKDQARIKQIIESRARDLKAKAMSNDPK